MAKLQTLTEDWSSGAIGANWDDGSVGQASIVSQQLNIASTLANGYYEVNSHVTYDLTSSYAYTQLVNAGNQSITSLEVYPLLIKLNSTNQLEFFITNNTIYVRKQVAGVETVLRNDTAYDSTVHKWFRIREAGGTTYFDYSTDGVTWTNYTSLTNPFSLTAVTVQQMVGTYNTETSTTTAIFDNFNITNGTTTSTSTSSSTSSSTSTTTTSTSTSSSTTTTTSTSSSSSTSSSTSTTTTILPLCDNLATNPSFENGTPGNLNAPTNWTMYGGTPDYKGVANDFAADGNQSFKIQSLTTDVDCGIVITISGLSIGQALTLSAFVKTDANVVNANLTLDTSQRNVGGALTGNLHVGANNNSRVALTGFVTDATSVNIFLGLGSFGQGSHGTVWFDEILLEQSTSMGAYCPVFTTTSTSTSTTTTSTSSSTSTTTTMTSTSTSSTTSTSSSTSTTTTSSSTSTSSTTTSTSTSSSSSTSTSTSTTRTTTSTSTTTTIQPGLSMAALQYKSVDIMKLTKDNVNNQLSDAQFLSLISTIKTIGVTHIAFAVPMDSTADMQAHGTTPSPRTMEALVQKICDTIHGQGLNVLFRGTWSAMENIWNFPYATGANFYPQGITEEVLGQSLDDTFPANENLATLYNSVGSWATNNSNQLVSSTSDAWYKNILYTKRNYSDVTALCKVVFNSAGHIQLAVRVHTGGSGHLEGYGVQIRGDSNEIRIERFSLANLASIPFTPVNGQAYWIKVYLSGSTIAANVWADGTAEPAGRMISVNDTTYTYGAVGVGSESYAGALFSGFHVTPTPSKNSWLGKTYTFIINNPNYWANGDIFACIPEPTGNAFNGNSFVGGGAPNGDFYDNFIQFFNDLVAVEQAAFSAINKNVIAGYTANNYSEIRSGYLAQSIFTTPNIDSVDYYGNYLGNNDYSANQYNQDIRNIYTQHNNIPIFWCEWGDLLYTNEYGSDRIAYEETMFDMMSGLLNAGILQGFNLWGGWAISDAGPTENSAILTKDGNGNYILNPSGQLLQRYFTNGNAQTTTSTSTTTTSTSTTSTSTTTTSSSTSTTTTTSTSSSSSSSTSSSTSTTITTTSTSSSSSTTQTTTSTSTTTTSTSSSTSTTSSMTSTSTTTTSTSSSSSTSTSTTRTTSSTSSSSSTTHTTSTSTSSSTTHTTTTSTSTSTSITTTSTTLTTDLVFYVGG